MTHYQYDDVGRMIRSVSVPESEWTKRDVALLLVSRRAEHERDENGLLWSEVLDPANKDAFTGPEKPIVNLATKDRLDRMDAYYKRWDKKDAPVNRNGHIWRVSKKPTE